MVSQRLKQFVLCVLITSIIHYRMLVSDEEIYPVGISDTLEDGIAMYSGSGMWQNVKMGMKCGPDL